MKQMILLEDDTTLEIDTMQIRRTKDRDVVTVKENKLFKVTGPKRRRKGQFDTLPYGYMKRQRQE